jgi:GntR family transcriptional regulator / MocR family aminotransferase
MGFDLHLELERVTAEGRGIGQALETALRDGVRTGRLPAGTRLPGTRQLAADLGVARGTVVHVFAQLTAEGWFTALGGSGTRVAPLSPAAERPAVSSASPKLDLRPGRPDVAAFPRAAWAATVRRVLTSADAALLDYPEAGGVPVLRTVLADYVARTRGVHATADSVIVTAGFRHGLALLARALHGVGVRAIAVENPSFELHRRILAGGGLETVPLPVDADGADPAALQPGTTAVMLTPAHQHPTGATLSDERRAAFVAWARRHGGFLVEDDYDGEFRYDKRLVGAVQAINPKHIVYAGSTSKALAPGLRIGWLVVPEPLRQSMMDVAGELGAAVPAIDQVAFAEFVERGEYDRHIRRMRQAYARRRAELVARLAPVRIDGADAGLHALVPVEDEQRVVARAAKAGLLLQGLHSSGYWTEASRPSAIVVGYAAPPAHAWRPALDALVSVIRAGDPSPAARPRRRT